MGAAMRRRRPVRPVYPSARRLLRQWPVWLPLVLGVGLLMALVALIEAVLARFT
jgi:hypothetical protein